MGPKGYTSKPHPIIQFSHLGNSLYTAMPSCECSNAEATQVDDLPRRLRVPVVAGTDFVREAAERVVVLATVGAAMLDGRRPRLGAGSTSGSVIESSSGKSSASKSAAFVVVRLRLVCVPVPFLSWRLLRAR